MATCTTSGLISFLRYTAPVAGFWYGKERLQFLRQQESDYQFEHEQQLKAKIKDEQAKKRREIEEINKKHHEQIAALEIEVLKASGKWTPPKETSGDSESLKFVDNLLGGKWESWMDEYVSNKLLNDITSALESPETFNLSSQAILGKMNSLK